MKKLSNAKSFENDAEVLEMTKSNVHEKGNKNGLLGLSSWKNGPNSLYKQSKKTVRTILHGKNENSSERHPSVPSETLEAMKVAVNKYDVDRLVLLIREDENICKLPNENGDILLHIVCQWDLTVKEIEDFFKLLVEVFSGGIGFMNESGCTPMHLLCMNPNVTLESMELLLRGFPGCNVMCDKASNLPLHYLFEYQNIANSKVVQQILQKQPEETLMMKNKYGSTPLHSICAQSLAEDVYLIEYLVNLCPSVLKVPNTEGRIPLHIVCSNTLMKLRHLEIIISQYYEGARIVDEYGYTALHYLVENRNITTKGLVKLLQANYDAVRCVDMGGQSPLHILCSNEAVCSNTINTLCCANPNLVETLDKQNSTPLHLLCMNTKMTESAFLALLSFYDPERVRELLTMQDLYGKTPLHYMCDNEAITPNLLWSILEENRDSVTILDNDGRSPLHCLCHNLSVNSDLLSILLECNSYVSLKMDKEMKLPIQYLLDNPSGNYDLAQILVTSRVLYRFRYQKICLVASPHNSSTKFLFICCGEEVALSMSEYVFDTKLSKHVILKYFSSQYVRDKEKENILMDEASCFSDLQVIDYFDDANKRVRVTQTIRENDSSQKSQKKFQTLQYALVVNAPVNTLDNWLKHNLKIKNLLSISTVIQIILDIGKSLAHWHLDLQMAHGDIRPEVIGEFSNNSFSLMSNPFSRKETEFGPHAVYSIHPFYCPPEIAKYLLVYKNLPEHGVKVVVNPSSDIWQFGCSIFEIITGNKLLQCLAPWVNELDLTSVTHQKWLENEYCGLEILHFISSLTDQVLFFLIESLSIPTVLKQMLTKCLSTDPSLRWSIDRILGFTNDNLKVSISNEEDISQIELSNNKDTIELQSNTTVNSMEVSEDENIDTSRCPKLVQDRLDYLRKENSMKLELLRDQKKKYDELEVEKNALLYQLNLVMARLNNALEEKEEVRIDYKLATSKQISLRKQLDTTVQMLMYVTPLAEKVYGKVAEDVLAETMLQAAASSNDIRTTSSQNDILSKVAKNIFQKDKEFRNVKNNGGLIRNAILKSGLSYGCLHNWASKSQSDSLVLLNSAEDDVVVEKKI